MIEHTNKSLIKIKNKLSTLSYIYDHDHKISLMSYQTYKNKKRTDLYLLKRHRLLTWKFLCLPVEYQSLTCERCCQDFIHRINSIEFLFFLLRNKRGKIRRRQRSLFFRSACVLSLQSASQFISNNNYSHLCVLSDNMCMCVGVNFFFSSVKRDVRENEEDIAD